MSLNFIKILGAYNLKPINREVLYKISSADVLKKLVKTKYIKCANFENLRETLNKYDVVYSKNELLEAFILKFFVGYSVIPPVIFGCHTSPNYPHAISIRQKFRNFLYGGFVYKFLSGDVTAFHTLNTYDQQFTQQLFPDKKVVKIYNPFDFAGFADFKIDPAVIENFEISPNIKKILWLGTLTTLKGIDDLVQIITMVNSQPKNLTILEWVIAGNGPDVEKITKLASTYGNVKYLGYVEHTKVPTLISTCDLLISTSLVETFSFVTLEANALNKPVFSYKTSGQLDIIEDTVNGKLISNVSEFTSEINKFLEGCYNFNDISTYIRNKFNSTEIYTNLVALFSSCVKRKF